MLLESVSHALRGCYPVIIPSTTISAIINSLNSMFSGVWMANMHSYPEIKI